MITGLPISERLANGIKAARSAQKRVLLVEDDDNDALLAMEELEQWGYKTIRVHSGENAISEAARTTFDFAIIDMNLPTMSGLECATLLNSQYDNLVIVICSGYIEGAKAVLDVLSRQWVMMKKPFSIDLFNRIAHAVNTNVSHFADTRHRNENQLSIGTTG